MPHAACSTTIQASNSTAASRDEGLPVTPDLGMQHRHEEAFRKLTMNEEGAIEHDLGSDRHQRRTARSTHLRHRPHQRLGSDGRGPGFVPVGRFHRALRGSHTRGAHRGTHRHRPHRGDGQGRRRCPELALAIGYDIDAAFEVLFEPEDQSLGSGSAEGVGAVGPDATEEREVSMGPRSCRTP